MGSEWGAVARPPVGWGMWPGLLGLGRAGPRSWTFLMEESSRNPLQGVLEAQVRVPTQPQLRLLLPLSLSSGPVPPHADPVLPGPHFLFMSPATLALPSLSTLPVGDPALNPSRAHCPLHLRASWHHRGKGFGGRELCPLPLPPGSLQDCGFRCRTGSSVTRAAPRLTSLNMARLKCFTTHSPRGLHDPFTLLPSSHLPAPQPLLL